MLSSEILKWKRDCNNTCFHETKNFDTETNQLKVDESFGTPKESKRKRSKVETAAPTIK